MTDALTHRGPDGSGFYRKGPVGLGHRRLSIIDLVGGRQPIASEDGSVQVICNGEIYNYVELRRDLEARGHRFRTNTDTEAIVHQYEESETDCVRHLRGMFAFALWDERRRRLLLARDRLGKKPLWWQENGRSLRFASELQALLKDPAVERTVAPEAVDLYLTYGYVPSPRSIFSGISKLPPAHRLVREGGRTRVERYWRLSYAPKRTLSLPQAQEEFESLLEEAVRIRLRSDVPVGAFLSGGLDSSAVVAAMVRLSSKPVRTFSIGFEEQENSELPYARQVARALGTEHHERVVRPEAAAILPDLVRHYGDPYADSSCIPTYYVARETRRSVTVALNGDGGDESFAGYPRYLGAALSASLEGWTPWVGRLARPFRALARAGQAGQPVTSTPHRLLRFLEAQTACTTLEERYLRWVGYFSAGELEALYTPEFRNRLNGIPPAAFLENLYRQERSESIAERWMAVDVQSYLPEDLLVKVDIASMVHALEVRSPLLDHRLMEFAARLPIRYKLRGWTTKFLLRRTLAETLPREILRRPKMGFGIPLGRWLQRELNDWMRQILLDPRSLRRGIFRPQAVERLIEEHTAALRDHRYRLWALIMFELWSQALGDRAS